MRTTPTQPGLPAGLSLPDGLQRAVTALWAYRWPGAAALAVLGLTATVWWLAANRSALGRRVTLRMVPTDAFDPTPEALRRWGAAIASTRRRRDWFVRRATGIRFRLTGPAGGRVSLALTCPASAVAVLEAHCPHQVELERVEIQSERPASAGEGAQVTPAPPRFAKVETARAELVLTSARHPLAVLDLAPDPLAPLVAALGDLAEGETAEVVMDLLPLSGRQRRADRRHALRAERGGGSGRSFAEDLHAEVMGRKTGKSSPSSGSSLERMEDRTVAKSRHARLAPAEPGFSVQVLVAASGPRCRALVATLCAGFSPAGDRGAWRRAGLGPWLWGGADARSRRRFFDRRLESGWFRPRRPNVVSGAEIAGWVKPPSRHCGAANALRSGGLVPPPPSGLPTWSPDSSGLFPLGEVTERGEKRWVGVPLGESLFSLSTGISGGGKALELTTDIPTPSGWTTMGELRVGDELFDDQGRVCRVTFATPVMYDHECFEVEFSDHSVIVADADHQWVTSSDRERATAGISDRRVRRPRNIVAAALAEELLAQPNGPASIPSLIETFGGYDAVLASVAATLEPVGITSRRGSGHQARLYDRHAVLAGVLAHASAPYTDQQHKRYPLSSVRTTREIAATLMGTRGSHNHAVAVCGPLQYPGAVLPLPVDPYVLGAWLGDGSSADGRFTSADVEIIEQIRAAGYEVNKYDDQGGTRPYAWGIRGLSVPLKHLGVRGDKHIPVAYLRAAVPDRLALLQGLMDTDGYVMENGRCEFTSTKERLAMDVLELLHGLGVKVAWRVTRARLDGRDCGPCWRMNFTPRFAVFRLPRKFVRQHLTAPRATRGRRYIIDVRPVESVPVRCITVDSPSHQFLAGRSCIPTHNTTAAIVRALALAHEPDGPMRPGFAFLDPHGDALASLRPYLLGVADRVLEVDLARDDNAPQAAWNPLDMTGCDHAEIGRRVSLVSAAFSAALEWGPANNRGLNLVSQATTALCEIGLLLPPALQPTLFQITPLLTDERWRNEVIRHLSPYSAGFWAGRLKNQSGGAEATSPVTNLVDRLHSSRQIAALFGQSRSTFDLRRAMDAGNIVLLCPGSGEDKDQMVHALFLFELHRAAVSRRDLDPSARRPFHAFVDEMQIADRGSASVLVASMCQQDRKFGLRLHGMVQQPDALQPKTLAALMTNRSHLFSTAVSHSSGALLADQMGGRDVVDPSVFTRLPMYHHVASVTLGRQRSTPFKLRGLSVEEAWGEPAGAGAVAALDATVDATMRRRPVAEVLAELDTLDGRILDALRGRDRAPSGTVPAGGRRFAVVGEPERGWSAG